MGRVRQGDNTMADPILSSTPNAHARALLTEHGPTLQETKESQRAELELLDRTKSFVTGAVEMWATHAIEEKAIEMGAELVHHLVSASASRAVSAAGAAAAYGYIAEEIT